jgi:hypothetical protein
MTATTTRGVTPMKNDETTPDAPATRPRFLKLADLAARWDVTDKAAIDIVCRRSVPFIRMTGSLARVNWAKVRFLLDAIEAWEEGSQERFRGEPPAAAALPKPAAQRRRQARHGESTEPTVSLLSNWRARVPIGPRQPREDGDGDGGGDVGGGQRGRRGPKRGPGRP